MGYQYVCFHCDGKLGAYSRILPRLEDAVDIVPKTNAVIDGAPDTKFIIGHYVLYDLKGEEVPDESAERLYKWLQGIDDSFAVSYPMMYVYNRCPLKLTEKEYFAVVVQYRLHGPATIGIKESTNKQQAITDLKYLYYETLDDGPVFKAIVQHPSKRPTDGGSILVPMKLIIYSKDGQRANMELVESIKGIRFHPSVSLKQRTLVGCG